MSSLSQHVPNFLQGMSDQPDQLKQLGQLRDSNNAFPDLTSGLIKRNGLKYKYNFPASVTQEGKWFHIEKEDPQLGEEEYVGVIRRDGGVQVFDLNGNEFEVCYSQDPLFRKRFKYPVSPPTTLGIDEDGLDCTSTATDPYLIHTTDSQLQMVTVNDYTFVTNRKREPEMVRTLNNPKYYEAFVEIYNVAYGRVYTFGVYDLDGNEFVVPEYSTPTTGGGTIRAGTILESWLTDFQETPTTTTTTGTGTWTNSGEDPENPDNNFWYLEPEADVTSTDDKDVNTGIITQTTVDLSYGAGQITQQSIPKNDPAPSSTPEWTETTTVTEGKIADFQVKIVGEGLYIYSETTPFVVSTTEEDIINVLSPSVEGIEERKYYSIIPNAGDLPRSAPQGFIVKVINSTVDEDDYYLEFNGNQSDVGSGSWNEIAAPDVYNEIDVGTMPHQIIRNRVINPDGSLVKIRFLVSPVDWEPRRAGDDLNNKRVSCLPEEGEIFGRPINEVMFYRNRLVLLSDENIILSQAGDIFNLWRESMLGINEGDPIDLNCSTNSTAVLYAGSVTNSGLVLFSPTTQFLFTTDADRLGPKTAKTNVLASYDFNTQTEPFKMGTNIGFLSSAGSNSVMYQMSDTMREGEPSVVEQSKVVNRSFPAGLNIIAQSKEQGLVIFGKKNSKEVWCYKYFFDGEKIIQSAWFKWQWSGTLVYHWKINDTYYCVLKDEETDELTFNEFSLKDRLELTTAYNDRVPYFIFLDQFVEVQPDDMTYDATANTTSFDIGYTLDTKKPAFAYSLGTNDYRGRATPPTSVDGKTITIPGNWTDSALAFGYNFEFKVVFPTNYVKQVNNQSTIADVNSSLTIHRSKFDLGTTSYCEFHLTRYGMDDYVMPYEARELDNYIANTPAVKLVDTITVPVYTRNTNYTLQCVSEYPGPLHLFSMVWEGDFTNRFYKRA